MDLHGQFVEALLSQGVFKRVSVKIATLSLTDTEATTSYRITRLVESGDNATKFPGSISRTFFVIAGILELATVFLLLATVAAAN